MMHDSQWKGVYITFTGSHERGPIRTREYHTVLCYDVLHALLSSTPPFNYCLCCPVGSVERDYPDEGHPAQNTPASQRGQHTWADASPDGQITCQCHALFCFQVRPGPENPLRGRFQPEAGTPVLRKSTAESFSAVASTSESLCLDAGSDNVKVRQRTTAEKSKGERGRGVAQTSGTHGWRMGPWGDEVRNSNKYRKMEGEKGVGLGSGPADTLAPAHEAVQKLQPPLLPSGFAGVHPSAASDICRNGARWAPFLLPSRTPPYSCLQLYNSVIFSG